MQHGAAPVCQEVSSDPVYMPRRRLGLDGGRPDLHTQRGQAWDPPGHRLVQSRPLSIR